MEVNRRFVSSFFGVLSLVSVILPGAAFANKEPDVNILVNHVIYCPSIDVYGKKSRMLSLNEYSVQFDEALKINRLSERFRQEGVWAFTDSKTECDLVNTPVNASGQGICTTSTKQDPKGSYGATAEGPGIAYNLSIENAILKIGNMLARAARGSLEPYEHYQSGRLYVRVLGAPSAAFPFQSEVCEEYYSAKKLSQDPNTGLLMPILYKP